jgi:hypothetical protein
MEIGQPQLKGGFKKTRVHSVLGGCFAFSGADPMKDSMRLLTLATVIFAGGCTPVVEHWPVQPAPAVTAARDFNLLWAESDENGLPLNPFWGPQQSDRRRIPAVTSACMPPDQPFRSACTDQSASVRVDEARGVNNLICNVEKSPFPGHDFHGHANWTPATLTGQLTWSNWNTGDNDINFIFVPDDVFSGLTTCNDTVDGSGTKCDPASDPDKKYVELEFAEDELLAPTVTPQWTRIKDAVQKWADSEGAVVDLDTALNPAHPGQAPRVSVLGLFGLDCEHGCKSEVHPVYALAIELDSSPSHNQWAILARNWGTEGFCSSKNHLLDGPNNQIRLRLPSTSTEMPTATADAFAASYPSTPQPTVEFLSGKGAIVTASLPPPDATGILEFVVTLNWLSPRPPAAMRPAAATARAQVRKEAEARLTAPASRHAAQPRRVQSAVQKAAPLSTNAIVVQPFDPRRTIATAPAPPVKAAKATAKEKRTSDQDAVRRTCAANAGLFPGVPENTGRSICAKAK